MGFGGHRSEGRGARWGRIVVLRPGSAWQCLVQAVACEEQVRRQRVWTRAAGAARGDEALPCKSHGWAFCGWECRPGSCGARVWLSLVCGCPCRPPVSPSTRTRPPARYACQICPPLKCGCWACEGDPGWAEGGSWVGVALGSWDDCWRWPLVHARLDCVIRGTGCARGREGDGGLGKELGGPMDAR